MAKSRPSPPDVDTFLAGLRHPRKPDLQAVRAAMLAASPRISEGIKWNSPSFRTTQWFATVNVHGKESLRLILHRGAKVRADTLAIKEIADSAGLLKWLGKDRAMVEFTDAVGPPLAKALQALVRQWISHV